MKKTIFHIGMLAVAALAFVACNKENEIGQPQEETHIATISLGKAIDTKTAVVEGATSASYKWLDDDAQYLHVYENGTAGEIMGFNLNSDKTIATITVAFTGNPSAPYSYTAKYAKDLSSSKNPLIQNEQFPATDSFDPSADVLVSKESSEVTNVDTRLSEFTFTMGRVVTVNKMTLTGLTAGEVVSSVEFTLDKHMAGYVSYDSANSNYSYSSGGTKLTMKYTATNGVVPSNGQFPVYFISAPVDAAGIVSVVVVTDQNVYTKSNSLDPNPFDGKTITFAVGTMKRFTMGMSGYGTPITAGVDYTLVESNDDLFDGATYIIVGTDVDYAVGLYTGGNNHTAVAITKSLNAQNKSIVTVDNTVAVEPVLLTQVGSNWTIKNNVSDNTYFGQYLICGTGTNNRLQETDSESNAYKEWTIAISSGVATINNTNSAASRTQLYFNQNGSSPMFACYAPGQTNSNYHTVALYVDKTTCKELADPELSFEGEATINVAWADIEDFTAPTLNNPNGVTVTYSSSNTDVATVDSTTGEIEFIGDGTTVITATSLKTDEFKAGSAQYTLVVTGAPISYDFTTVAELNALVTTTSSTYNGFLTDAVVSFVPSLDTRVAIVKDATGSVMFFKSGHTLKQGQTYTGDIEVTAIKYNGLYSEVTAWDATFTGTETTDSPERVTLSDLIGHYDDYQNAYVVVQRLTVTNIDGKNIHVSDGTNTYVVYYNPGTPSVGVGDNITVFGTITKYGDTEQIKVWSSSDYYVNSYAPKAITFSQPSETGCSITVTIDGNAITSGTTVASGTTVTLAATVGNGYTFGGWTVSGAEVVNASATTTTFTMGNSAVSIRALFTSASGTTYTKVTSVPSDWSGTYILVYESSENSGLVCLAGTDAYQNYTTATISSGVITSNDLSDYEVEIASYSTGYSVKALGGTNANKYLEGKGSSSNGTAFAASPSKVTTLNLSDGVVTITNNTNLFVYNSTSGENGERWRFYKSGTAAGSAYKTPALYKKN